MKFLEKDLEQIIYETDNKILKDKGLNINGKKLRQLRIGNYGIADLITYHRDGNYFDITVYELKKEKIGISAFLQSVRYTKGIKSFLSKRFKDDVWYSINVVLIGKQIDNNGSFCFIPDMTNFSFYTYHYEFDGLKFENHRNYVLTNEGF